MARVNKDEHIKLATQWLSLKYLENQLNYLSQDEISTWCNWDQKIDVTQKDISDIRALKKWEWINGQPNKPEGWKTPLPPEADVIAQRIIAEKKRKKAEYDLKLAAKAKAAETEKEQEFAQAVTDQMELDTETIEIRGKAPTRKPVVPNSELVEALNDYDVCIAAAKAAGDRVRAAAAGQFQNLGLLTKTA